MSDDYDSPWKNILNRYFADFMAMFLPHAHAEIDWQCGWESLDTELSRIVRDADLGKRLADKLMKVYRHDGTEQYVLIHVEVQGEYDSDLPQRMFVYHYRLYDAHQQPIASIAVLGDDSPTWRPDYFQEELWGCRKSLHYPVIKLLDYQPRWSELAASRNPFAVMVMAHLSTRATRHDPDARRSRKFELVRSLYEKGFAREDILELFNFIDWLLALPESLEQAFQADLSHYEATMSKPYITAIERSGFERGIQQGMQQGEANLLRRQLQRRFGPLPDWALQRLQSALPAQLDEWGERLLDANSLETVFDDN